MSYDPVSYLGLACLSGGNFYVCQNDSVPFLGCCTVNPCGKNGGSCPTGSLSQTTFDQAKYSEIPGQSCVKYSTAGWYTCVSGPTFLGCCTSNPCANDGVCPQEDLVGALLNKNPKDAAIFLTGPATTTTSTSSPPTSTSSPPPTAGSKVSTGTIVGAVIGGIAGLLILILLAFRCGRRRKTMEPMSQPDDYITPHIPVGSPFHESFRGSAAGRASVSTLSTLNTRRWSPMSILSLKWMGGGKNRTSRMSYDHGTAYMDHHGVELDVPPPQGGMHGGGPGSPQKIYHEIQGSMPLPPEPREMAT